MKPKHPCCVYLDEKLAAYGFGDEHPFGPQRHAVFEQALYQKSLDEAVDILPAVTCDRATLELFHTADYIETVRQQSKFGTGYLDRGDTPAFIGMYEAASAVAGSVCDAADHIMARHYHRAFIPIAGLHHARRHTAAGFCVVNDCGIVIEYLRHRHRLNRIAYIDIDAHHGDGVFYSFEDDAAVIFVDIHEDGGSLYPGTGNVDETGSGEARGYKLNIPMPAGADDEAFFTVWRSVEQFLERFDFEFILMQCGADSIADDPITHLRYSEKAHAFAAGRLRRIADTRCDGRLLAMGGGGYNHDNIARTWTAVVESLT